MKAEGGGGKNKAEKGVQYWLYDATIMSEELLVRTIERELFWIRLPRGNMCLDRSRRTVQFCFLC